MFLVPILRGIVFGIIGFLVGSGLGAVLNNITGHETLDQGPIIAVGYLFGLIGWLLGVGVAGKWVKEWIGLPVDESNKEGWPRYFTFCTDHKVIGIQYLVTFFVVLLLAGALAMLLRLELMSPGKDYIGSDLYNTAMSLHGIMAVAVAVAIMMGGFANFVLPLLIGAEDVAFPRINALSFWIVPPVAILLLATPFAGGFDSGWTAYPPLSVVNADGQLLFLLAFLTFGLSSILGGLNFITTTVMLRAPGMSWSRLPIFVWSVLAAAVISLTATQFVAFALLSVILDRVVGMSFYNASEGGSALLYEHLFWFYSHPAVYIMVLPAFGLVLEILAHFSRKPLFAYKWVVGSFFVIVFLSFIVWAHHLFTSGMNEGLHLPFMVTTELISIPTGMVFLAGLGTIWRGRMSLSTPMLFALIFFWNFSIGGLTGIHLADVPTDLYLQDTYFVVAHFHYTIMGAEIFAFVAGVYYWFPKMTGRMYNEALGKIHFWWFTVSYNLTFLTMFWVGLQGMNRRVADYFPGTYELNGIISIFSFLLGASFILMTYNLVVSWVKGPRAPANPWNALTLEWQTSSPPPVENFSEEPKVIGSPYAYGSPDAAHSATSGPGNSR